MADEATVALNRLRHADAWASDERGDVQAVAALSHFLDSPSASKLDLHDCGLRSLPDELRHLAPRIRSLDVSTNRLQSLPEWIGDCVNLASLNICDNGILVLPDSIAKLTKLKFFDMGDFRTDVLPDWLRNCTELQSLICSACRLTELPEWLGEFEHLMYLDCSLNRLQELPESLANCPILSVLKCDDNAFIEPWKSLLVTGEESLNQQVILEHFRATASARRVKAARA